MPSEWEVCGFMLKPFCLQHFVTLQVFNSPIVLTEKSLQPEDLAIAIRVCSGYEGIMSLEKKPTLKEKWFNYKLANNPDFLEKCTKEFANYIKCYCEAPKLWDGGDEGSGKTKEKMPSHLALAVFLMKYTSLTENEIWRMPLGRAYWYTVAIGINEGGKLEVISTEDEEKMDSEMEQLMKLQAELSKSQGETKKQ
jgi:hypothetical protein